MLLTLSGIIYSAGEHLNSWSELVNGSIDFTVRVPDWLLESRHHDPTLISMQIVPMVSAFLASSMDMDKENRSMP